MSVSTVSRTRVDTVELTLRLHDPRPGEFTAEELARYLNDLQLVHDACAWMLYMHQYDQTRRIGPGPARVLVPLLVIRDLRCGSIGIDLVQGFGAAAGAGGALWMLARVLRQGPGKLHEWAGVLHRAQAEWIQQRTNVMEQRARYDRVKRDLERQNELLFDAHASSIRIVETTPKLEVRVVDDDHRDAAPPPSVFLENDDQAQ
jgi:hypothetical protein